MKKLITLIICTLCLWTINFTLPANALDTAPGAEIFTVHCAGCHINGGNIIRRGKNLKRNTLKKYGMDSLEAITTIVTNGKNNMSAYKDRLTTEEIQNVAAYVLEQAEKDWK
ncbi:MAG: c-type cytochrome [Nostocales cyanobacterium ELA583]|jgi:cytochrome c6